MTSITVIENGREEIVTDITRYIQERDTILSKLDAIYAGFRDGAIDALTEREPEIVAHVNRFHEVQHIIDTFENAGLRRANILAGWEIVQQRRTARP